MTDFPEYWTEPTPENMEDRQETPQADYGITLEPLDDQSGIDVEDVNEFTRWLNDVLNNYDGPFRIERDFLCAMRSNTRLWMKQNALSRQLRKRDSTRPITRTIL